MNTTSDSKSLFCFELYADHYANKEKTKLSPPLEGEELPQKGSEKERTHTTTFSPFGGGPRGRNTTQHNTTQHNTTQHNTTQHNTTQHNTTQHNTSPPLEGEELPQKRQRRGRTTTLSSLKEGRQKTKSRTHFGRRS